eukprot:gene47348-57997_t
MKPILGSIVALVTPMNEDGSIDYPALRRLIDWHVEEGTACVGVVGTTGESPTVSMEENREIIRVAVEHAKGRIPILAGTGANSTAEAIELSRYAKEVGADCTLSVVPYYNKPSQEGIYQHFKAIAQSTSLPIMLYSIPGRCGIEIGIDVVARLVEACPNIRAMKEAGADAAQALCDQATVVGIELDDVGDRAEGYQRQQDIHLGLILCREHATLAQLCPQRQQHIKHHADT